MRNEKYIHAQSKHLSEYRQVIIFWAGGILRKSAKILLEMVPSGLNIETVSTDLKHKFPELKEIFNIHFWTITSDMFVFTSHVKLDEDKLYSAKNLLSALNASKDAALNVFSGFGIKSITVEESEEEKEERSPLRQSIQGVFTPLSAYAFIAFVLLYWPCVVVAIATRQEFGTWKIYGQAVLIHTALAWITAFVIYQGGKALGLG